MPNGKFETVPQETFQPEAQKEKGEKEENYEERYERRKEELRVAKEELETMAEKEGKKLPPDFTDMLVNLRAVAYVKERQVREEYIAAGGKLKEEGPEEEEEWRVKISKILERMHKI